MYVEFGHTCIQTNTANNVINKVNESKTGYSIQYNNSLVKHHHYYY